MFPLDYDSKSRLSEMIFQFNKTNNARKSGHPKGLSAQAKLFDQFSVSIEIFTL